MESFIEKDNIKTADAESDGKRDKYYGYFKSILAFMKKNGATLIWILAAVASFAIVLYYILGPSEGYFHSDCTDSLYWANATYESGEIIDENFRYAAILPFSSSLWYIPLISLFGVTMGVQLAGMVIFLILFTAAIYFMCRSMKWSLSSCCAMISALLLILSGSKKLREIMWEHVIYYSLALLIIFVGIGLILRFMKSFDLIKTRPLQLAIFTSLILIVFTGNAFNGFQLIVISTLPVAVALILLKLFDPKTNILSKQNLSVLTAVLLIAVSTIIGVKLLDILKNGKTADYTSVYSTLSSTGDWINNLLKFPNSFFTLLGCELQSGAELFNKETIFDLIRFVGGCVILILPVVALFRYKHIKSDETKLLLWVHIVLSAAIMFGFVCGRLSNANWRLVPMVGTAVAASVAVIKEFLSYRRETVPDRANGKTELRVGVLLCAVLIMASAVNFIEIKEMPSDYGRDNTLHILASELEARGLEYGYATFWNSQAITVISDSKVRVRETLVNTSGVITDYYQSSRLWYEDQAGIDKYFILLSNNEYKTVSASEYWKKIMEESCIDSFQAAGHFIFVFNKNVILKGQFGS